MVNLTHPSSSKFQPTPHQDKLSKIAEQTSLWGGFLGTIFAAIYEPIFYTLLPFPIYFALINNSNRCRFEREQKARLSLKNSIANVNKKTQYLEKQIENLSTEASEFKRSQTKVFDDVHQSTISLEKQLKNMEQSMTQLEANSQRFLTKTHLCPIITKLRQVQHQQKHIELGEFDKIAPLIKELQKQVDELSASTLTLQKENQNHQQQLNLQQVDFRNHRYPRKKMPHRGKHDRIAIFIDAANLYHTAEELGIKIAYSQLLSVIKADSRVCRAYFYTGIDSTSNKEKLFLSRIHRSGFKIISKELIKRADGSTKANLDGEIISDMLMQGLTNSFDSAILVSGDGDFLDVVQRVQSLGKRVEVVSFSKNTHKSLIETADSYLDLMEIKEQVCQSHQLLVCS